MNWTELLKSEVESSYRPTEALVAQVEGLPLDWKPSAENNWMTTGQLLLHLCSNSCGSAMKGFVTGDWGMPEGDCMEGMEMESMLPPAEKMPTVESVQRALELLAEDKRTALEMIDRAGEERLDTEPAPAPWDPQPMPLGQRLLSMVAHLNTHKAQLFYYLKLQGKTVNTMDLWVGGEA